VEFIKPTADFHNPGIYLTLSSQGFLCSHWRPSKYNHVIQDEIHFI